MGQGLPAPRHSSLPPSPTRAGYDHSSTAVVRHGSLPPAPTLPRTSFPSPAEGPIEETDETINSDDSAESVSESVRVTESPPQNPTTLRVQANPANVSQP